MHSLSQRVNNGVLFKIIKFKQLPYPNDFRFTSRSDKNRVSIIRLVKFYILIKENKYACILKKNSQS